jgi:2-oxoglutarate ferredoxin oxidoreductase subunit alpha
MYTLTMLAFDLADKYRTPAMILGDAIVGLMKEPFVATPYDPASTVEKPWALTGCVGRERLNVKSLYLKDNAIEVHNWKLHEKYERIRKDEARAESYMLEGATIAIVAFGTAARVSKTAIQWARKEGIAAGMLRPITLFPFPGRAVFGQMVEDVRQCTPLHDRIAFLGKPCAMPTPEEILERIRLLAGRKG